MATIAGPQTFLHHGVGAGDKDRAGFSISFRRGTGHSKKLFIEELSQAMAAVAEDHEGSFQTVGLQCDWTIVDGKWVLTKHENQKRVQTFL